MHTSCLKKKQSVSFYGLSRYIFRIFHIEGRGLRHFVTEFLPQDNAMLVPRSTEMLKLFLWELISLNGSGGLHRVGAFWLEVQLLMQTCRHRGVVCWRIVGDSDCINYHFVVQERQRVDALKCCGCCSCQSSRMTAPLRHSHPYQRYHHCRRRRRRR